MTGLFATLLIILSIVFIALLVRVTLLRAKALSEHIDEYHREQEAQKQQPGPIDPYRQMGEVFGPQADNDEDEPGKTEF